MPTELAAPPPVPDAVPRPIAPWLHTAAFFLVLVYTTLAGRARAAATLADELPRLPRYASSIFLEWLLLGAVIAGIYRRREFFLAALRSRATSVPQVLGLGVAAYFGAALAVAAVAGAAVAAHLTKVPDYKVVLAMAPQTPLEFLVWFGVSLSAGVCEEFIFRGYLLQQLTAWTRRPILAIFLGGAIFGVIHLYEGPGAILPIATLGIVYGFIVHVYKGDLRAVMVAHTLQDFLVALFTIALRHHPELLPK